MRKLFAFFSILVASLAFFACTDDENKPDSEQSKTTWELTLLEVSDSLYGGPVYVANKTLFLLSDEEGAGLFRLTEEPETYTGEYSIPYYVSYGGKQYPVTSISRIAFGNCYNLTKVNIPSSVKRIEWAAFSYCTGLTSISIPQSVECLRQETFAGCTGLTSVELPASLISWGNPFAYCPNIKNIKITGSGDNIRMENNCLVTKDSMLVTTLNVPNLKLPAVKGIHYAAFGNFDKLTTIELPETLEEIGQDAFRGCKALKEIRSLATCPPSIVGWWDGSFEGINMEECIVRVPTEAVRRYKTYYPWYSFKITSLDDQYTGEFDANKQYLLMTNRGFMPAGEEMRRDCLYPVQKPGEAGRFKIQYDARQGGYMIYNIGLQKYLCAQCENYNYCYTSGKVYTEQPDGTFSIYPGTEEEGGRPDTWIIMSNETGNS